MRKRDFSREARSAASRVSNIVIIGEPALTEDCGNDFFEPTMGPIGEPGFAVNYISAARLLPVKSALEFIPAASHCP
jgi:hypothetical protein